jgi:hypothetical protein
MSDTPTETRVVVATDDDMMSVTELLLLSAEHRFGRIADALETVATAATAGRDDVAGLTKQVERLADAFDNLTEILDAVTAKSKGVDDGVTRRTLRTCDFSPLALTTYGHGED